MGSGQTKRRASTYSASRSRRSTFFPCHPPAPPVSDRPARPRTALAAARTWYFARDYARAIRETRTGADTTINVYRSWTAELYIQAGDLAAAEAVLKGAAKQDVAEAYLAVGDASHALDLLQQAMLRRDVLVVDFKVQPLLDPLRNNPRFQEMMSILRFP